MERGTSSEELAKVFKDSGEIERLTLKEGFAFILFKEEASVPLACKLDGTCLNGLNLRVAPRKEKPPEVAGEVLLELDMKKFRHEKHPRLLRDIDEFLMGFNCVGSFSQDKKEPNTIIVPGTIAQYSIRDAVKKNITGYFMTLCKKVGRYLFQNLISFTLEIMTFVIGR